jgi:hypothetical protein
MRITRLLIVLLFFTPSELFAQEVQTGKMVYSTNRAHGLQWIGKEERADAVGGNQCYGSTSRVYR